VATKNAINKLRGTQMAPSIALQYVVDGTYVFAVIRCWCIVIMAVALAYGIVP